MKAKIKKTRYGFIPVDDTTKRWASKVKDGNICHFDIKEYRDQRNQKMLEKYWSMLQVFVDNSDKYRDKESLHHDLKWALDYVEYFQDPISNKMYKRVKSIAMDKMSQADFELFYSDAIDVLLKLCPIEAHELVNLILGFA